ncbi:bifunctional diaminohydroxyphosphoribosylaminopyrimidine deaminase/5-amino-6-(5-phosphoribosylamino)uracil reductase RibD [Tsukamurella sp. 8F]|uniref:bifunctional diaminohydroxyphosphoribosylaminopyrimidine deaminase/5-amino-6-(5-phosphoribosylamino)uracil reductase RibD n=1 Tax=unclassified Tsukamurella TaxID=2633480 RepID=UPI0023B9FC8B|nr:MULTISPECIES: bifunctional diaminohydroxyphosphoribosylaminopyrimidine deaminase/5-amino-6-(5-phosphoribosylamino)uracil reductase RibD [unclassified Tsukamurella]MDF0531047.1 bifunctional diaminohydroxyphosphoribosylaminopyrimidine deaminase/5-amino-6-(5-phosphoribosylamino)uracil reductase RibD [Tsukamurella sp. 8J]MDF0585486.1 bifunctional diaminohydroxyphosphoribosylaminopyrimidine deaminase/5-amino-6-(5-phosphoribosylamino)uracil reductase RibD [Tsukamurella sp. 8F]
MTSWVDAPEVTAALEEAVAASVAARGVSTPNPPVGAVILAADGTVAGVGCTAPAGGPHAEIEALRAAGDDAQGGTAVVTLEPCNHTGRTGPCAVALLEAGIERVAFAAADPNPVAAGGAEYLRTHGVEVAHLGFEPWPLREWLFRQRNGRPMVTLKLAATVDGRIGAPDGTSQWITGAEARERAHVERAQLDAIVVGTGTVAADDPALTARRPDGALHPHQPTRVVLGMRDLPAGARIGDAVHVRSHDPRAVLDALPDVLNVQVEGGATVAGAFVDAGLVDRVQAYIAPVLLGAGQSAVVSATVGTLADALRLRTDSVERLGDDVLLTLSRGEDAGRRGGARTP